MGAVSLYGIIAWVTWFNSTSPNVVSDLPLAPKIATPESKHTPRLVSPSSSVVSTISTEASTLAESAAGVSQENAVLLANFESPDPEVRKQALRDIIDLDDRSLNPRLLQIAFHTRDATERAKILAAVDFINLPNPDEYFASQGVTIGSGTNAPGKRTPHLVRHKRNQVDSQAAEPPAAPPVDPQPAQ